MHVSVGVWGGGGGTIRKGEGLKLGGCEGGMLFLASSVDATDTDARACVGVRRKV